MNIKKNYKFTFLVVFFLILSSPAFPLTFDGKFTEVKEEIIEGNLKKALKTLGSLKIETEYHKEQSQLLFGDIYLTINQPKKAKEFYEKASFSSREDIEIYANLGIAQSHLQDGKLRDAISVANEVLVSDSSNLKAKIILGTSKFRLGDKEEAKSIIINLYNIYEKNPDVVLAISNYYLSIEEIAKSISILENFLKIDKDNLDIMDNLAELYWLNNQKDKALEYKYKIYQYYSYFKNPLLKKKYRDWIVSVKPGFFENKRVNVTKKETQKRKREKFNNFEKRKIKPKYEDIGFDYNYTGSGFVVGNGKYVITNNHVIRSAERIAVRNGIGKVRSAKVVQVSKNYDLALLELSSPYPKSYSISNNDFDDPREGQDVLSIGYPLSGAFGNDKPVITQGIISKVYDNEAGIFLTTTNINAGNSGGPIFDLNGRLVGITVATLDKERIYKKTGRIPNAIGIAIKSNMLKEIFSYEKSKYTNVKYEKSQIYESKLPSVVFIAVKAPEMKK